MIAGKGRGRPGQAPQDGHRENLLFPFRQPLLGNRPPRWSYSVSRTSPGRSARVRPATFCGADSETTPSPIPPAGRSSAASPAADSPASSPACGPAAEPAECLPVGNGHDVQQCRLIGSRARREAAGMAVRPRSRLSERDCSHGNLMGNGVYGFRGAVYPERYPTEEAAAILGRRVAIERPSVLQCRAKLFQRLSAAGDGRWGGRRHAGRRPAAGAFLRG